MNYSVKSIQRYVGFIPLRTFEKEPMLTSKAYIHIFRKDKKSLANSFCYCLFQTSLKLISRTKHIISILSGYYRHVQASAKTPFKSHFETGF